MSSLNWLRVLNGAGIEYVERGPNVKRGEVNIKCPYCGQADPSHHMGLNLVNGWWACWRNQNHRGKSPLRLLVKLLRCSYQHACDLAGITADYVDPDGFDAVAARVMERDKVERMEEVRRDFLQLPREFRPLQPYGATRRHWEYLVARRGFRAQDMPYLSDHYCIRAAISGLYQDRIIFPYLVHGEPVTWTGRAIAEASLRYRDLPIAESLIKPKQTVYNHDSALAGGEVLVVVEGPVDALKLDCYGAEWGVRAVALSTNSMTEEQIYLVEELASNFSRVMMMMDNASSLGVVDSMRLKERLAQISNLGFIKVPFGAKDAGDLLPTQVVHFARTIT